jgi:CRP-like cAMP-binding protein
MADLRRPPSSRRSQLDAADFLGTVGMFAALPWKQRELIAQSMVLRHARRRETVFVQGAPADALYVVVRGSVLLRRTGRTGERRGLTMIERRGVFGEAGLVEGTRRPASAEAIDDTQLLALPRSDVLRLLSHEPLVAQGLLRELGRTVRRLTEQLTDATLLDLPARVAKTLVRIVEVRRAADPQALPIVTISQGKVAELAGASRQSVNAVLSTLAQRGLVRVDGGRILVTDMDGLRARAGLDMAAVRAGARAATG